MLDPTQILVDSDGGVDDIAALWYLLDHPGVEVVAITVIGGNVDLETAADNLARVTHLAGQAEIPIALGASEPFGSCPSLRPATFVHGTDGVGETGRRPPPWTPYEGTAVELIAHSIEAHPGLTILTLGPLANLATFVTLHPDLVPTVGDLVVMGGAVAVQGNALPTAEANIAHDPTAASTVATAAWARPPLLVALDVTLAATLAADEFELLATGASPAALDLAAPLDFYRGAGSTFSPPGESPCHDLTAAVLAIEPHLATAPVLPFGVDVSGGLAWGTTVVDRRQPFFERAGAGSAQALPEGFVPWRIALEIDIAAVRERYRHLLGAPRQSDRDHPTGERSPDSATEH